MLNEGGLHGHYCTTLHYVMYGLTCIGTLRCHANYWDSEMIVSRTGHSPGTVAGTQGGKQTSQPSTEYKSLRLIFDGVMKLFYTKEAVSHWRL